MLSDATVTLMLVAVTAMAVFLFRSFYRGGMKLIHKLYSMVTICVMIWMLAVVAADAVNPSDKKMLYIWDAITYLGVGFAPALGLLIALTFTHGWDKLPKRYYLVFVIPALTNLVVWTNPLHHLLYEEFSLYRSQLVFGPYIYISGAFSYICTLLSIVIMTRYALKIRQRLVIQQALLFCGGSFIPGMVSLMGTLQLADLSIAATPIAFIATVVLHGYAIYHFHLLDIRPVAMQKVLDWITDCYVLIDEGGHVVDTNKAFDRVFGAQFGTGSGKPLSDRMKAEDVENKTAVYNVITAMGACRRSKSVISFEQSVFIEKQKFFYMVDVTPLTIDSKLEAFVVIFKDVTKVRDGMQRLHDSQARMMEQERLASLGQMVGGLAHNLKTPIMSISGSTVAVDNLVDESLASLGDPEVTEEDYREIYLDMRIWLKKIRDACAYMSDIITAVKDQAANIDASDGRDFTFEELMKRVSLLLRHELQGGTCRLTVLDETGAEFSFHGDINNLVQVMNNLVGNAIDAMRPKGGGEITARMRFGEGELVITVEDHGIGVPPEIKRRIFKQMITNKGALGTGLGVYISNTVVRAKFGGHMWLEDNPGGGAVFALAIPFEYTTLADKAAREVSER